jgi:hypothetical protein
MKKSSIYLEIILKSLVFFLIEASISLKISSKMPHTNNQKLSIYVVCKKPQNRSKYLTLLEKAAISL